jgi:Protein of unknown function (DUF3450)
MWRSVLTDRHLIQISFGVLLSATLSANSALLFAADTAGDQYARVMSDADSLERYNQQVNQSLEAQQMTLASIQQEILDMDATATAVVSLVQRMYEAFDEFLDSDLPFLDPTQASPDSRKDRMNRIRELMESEETSVGERYRRLIEAYQIELEYGRTMFAYKGTLDDGREADFLRLGRVSLVYRTVDGDEAGYWDAAQKAWVIDSDLAKTVHEAIQIATKEIAPDLVILPVPAPREVQL